MAKGSEKLLIGAHTSASGGVFNALLEGKQIGATTIQLFTANQRQWKAKPLSDENIQKWKETLAETGLSQIMSHDSYLINLGSPKEENLQKSKLAFSQEIQRCNALEISYLNFHPGASVGSSEQECLDTICNSLLEFEKEMKDSPTRLLLESTAGQGTTVGWRFEHLSYIIEKVKDKLPIGVCIDTCHTFVAGYDLRTKEAVDTMLNEFDKVVGLQHLYAFHFNDSVKGLGSRVDRHKPLGEGEIGLECFSTLMNDKRTRHLPKYLETPGGLELWEKEIKLLIELAETSNCEKSRLTS